MLTRNNKKVIIVINEILLIGLFRLYNNDLYLYPLQQQKYKHFTQLMIK
jgi:hypothetical protein